MLFTDILLLILARVCALMALGPGQQGMMDGPMVLMVLRWRIVDGLKVLFYY
jgi:hypothetical protein